MHRVLQLSCNLGAGKGTWREAQARVEDATAASRMAASCLPMASAATPAAAEGVGIRHGSPSAAAATLGINWGHRSALRGKQAPKEWPNSQHADFGVEERYL